MDLNQVTLDVADLERSARFYESLGLRRIVWSAPRYARYECPVGSATLSLHCTTVPDAEPPAAGGAALYFEVEDVDARVADLEALGVVFVEAPRTQDWRWREAWTSDPDGRRVCIFHAGADRRFPPWRVDGAVPPV
jgi:catechol 2,3-dioxygenase-like lactoylglutathione lyase family enzyme